MAGFYPDAPAPRFAYDRDTSVIVARLVNLSSSAEFTLGEKQSLNNEIDGFDVIVNGTFTSSGHVCFIFSELRDIVGYLIAGGNGASIETSTNTTNGLDGTWTFRASWVNSGTVTPPTNRTAIQAVSYTGIKAIRFGFGGNGNSQNACQGLHLYGRVTATENPNRLRLWHPTLDQPLDDHTVSPDGAYFDWGDIQRSTQADRTFRLKNNSATQTASSITLTREALTDTSPTTIGQHTFSSDGVSFSSSLSVPNLSPGALSGVLYLRRVTPSNAALGLWTLRLVATATFS